MKKIFTSLFIIVMLSSLQSQTLFESFDTHLSSKYIIKKHGTTENCYTNIFLDNETFIEGNGAVRVKYNVESTEDWGGSSLLQLKPLVRGDLWDLSEFDSLSISFYNKVPCNWKGRATLQIIFYDASDLDDKGSGLSKHEWWYSFHKVLDLDSGWTTINLPLKDVGNNANKGDGSSGFWLTGWGETDHEGTFDLDQISGFGFNISIDGPKDGALVNGEFILDNWFFKSDQTAPISVSAFQNPRDIAIEPDGNLVTTDANLRAIVRANPSTGELHKISSWENGSGPRVILHRGIAVDANGDILVVDSGPNRVTKVNPKTGHRVALSDSTKGTGPYFKFPRCIDVETNGQILVSDSDLDAVVRVDPATGNRSILSDMSTGNGPELKYPRGISIESDGNILVTDLDLSAVFRINPKSGNRSILSDSKNGSGPLLGIPRGIAIESEKSIIVTDETLKAVVRIDAETGDRTIVSDANTGNGINLELPRAVDIMKNGEIVVFDRGLAQIVYVNPVSGDRSISPNLTTNNEQIPKISGTDKTDALSQNFPNPFDTKTNIPIHITAHENVKLSVFNSVGHKVVVLVDQILMPGSYNIEFNSNNLPTGIYYFRLQIGENAFTRKGILTR